jgi:hypothetical protein
MVTGVLMVVPPTVKVTVPVGATAPDTTGMQYVNVTGFPKTVGFGVAVSVSEVPTTAVMVSVVVGAPAEYVLSPGYLAVIGSAPTGNELVVKVATPDALTVPVPIGVVPL